MKFFDLEMSGLAGGFVKKGKVFKMEGKMIRR